MDQADSHESEASEGHQADGRFDALMEAAVDAIVLIDARGTILEFSRAATEMFGYSSQEVIGKNVSILMPQPYRSEHDQYIQKYLETGNARIIGLGREVEAQAKSGRVFPVDLAVGEVGGKSSARFVGIIRDITARKASELEMREQRERLAHVTRLSTMGEMAAGIAHEVNQPLTAIATYSNASRRMLKTGNPALSELEELLDKISAQALRAGEVIRRLRGFVKKRAGVFTLTSVNELVQEIAELAEVDADHHRVALVLKLCSKNPIILADEVQIQQVLLNLIRNAIEAVAPMDIANRVVAIKITQDEDRARVEVVDRGPGIDAAVARNLFLPFQTTKDSGMGLGLSISRSIIEAHKGELGFRKNPKGGTIFHFDLPLTRETARA